MPYGWQGSAGGGGPGGGGGRMELVETEKDRLIRLGVLTPFDQLAGFERRVQRGAAGAGTGSAGGAGSGRGAARAGARAGSAAAVGVGVTRSGRPAAEAIAEAGRQALAAQEGRSRTRFLEPDELPQQVGGFVVGCGPWADAHTAPPCILMAATPRAMLCYGTLGPPFVPHASLLLPCRPTPFLPFLAILHPCRSGTCAVCRTTSGTMRRRRARPPRSARGAPPRCHVPTAAPPRPWRRSTEGRSGSGGRGRKGLRGRMGAADGGGARGVAEATAAGRVGRGKGRSKKREGGGGGGAVVRARTGGVVAGRCGYLGWKVCAVVHWRRNRIKQHVGTGAARRAKGKGYS